MAASRLSGPVSGLVVTMTRARSPVSVRVTSHDSRARGGGAVRLKLCLVNFVKEKLIDNLAI